MALEEWGKLGQMGVDHHSLANWTVFCTTQFINEMSKLINVDLSDVVNSLGDG